MKLLILILALVVVVCIAADCVLSSPTKQTEIGANLPLESSEINKETETEPEEKPKKKSLLDRIFGRTSKQTENEKLGGAVGLYMAAGTGK